MVLCIVTASPSLTISPSLKHSTMLGLACGVGAAFCWALGFVVARQGVLAGMSPVLVAMHRFFWPGLVLLPFVALLNGFAWSPVVRKAHQAVALLIEMHADDMARRHRPARELATALLRVGAAGGGLAPSGTLAAADPALHCDVAARVTRLLRPAPSLPVPALALVAVAATLAIVVPAAVLIMPF